MLRMKKIIDLKNKMELIVAFYLIYLIALLFFRVPKGVAPAPPARCAAAFP